MPRECVICGSPKTTEEHVWPEWLKSITAYKMGRYTVGLADAPEAARTWEGAALEHTARILCGPCNRRLGDELESPTAPLVRRLVAGTPTSITPAEQVLLTRWLIKTALMVALVNPERDAAQLPSGHYRRLASTLDPPTGTAAWVGRLEKRAQEVGYWTQRFNWWDRLLDDPRECEGYAFALAAGDLIGVVGVMDHSQSPGSDNMQPFELGGLDAGRLLRIWPSSTYFGLRWPPHAPLTPADVEGIRGSFKRMGRRLS